MKYLGIDYGGKHIGLAIGDGQSHFALPMETLLNRGVSECVSDIKNIIENEDIGSVVVGVPAMGSIFKGQKKEIEEFVETLKSHLTVPVGTSDESFSSRQAQRLLHETGKKTVDDHAVAAMLILQNFFDKKGQSA